MHASSRTYAGRASFSPPLPPHRSPPLSHPRQRMPTYGSGAEAGEGGRVPRSFLRVRRGPGGPGAEHRLSPSPSPSPSPPPSDDSPCLRAIGRYHCQNGNGPIKIPNRCYDRSFVVPYESAGIRRSRGWGRGRGGGGGGGGRRGTMFSRSHFDRIRSAINFCSCGRRGDARRKWPR